MPKDPDSLVRSLIDILGEEDQEINKQLHQLIKNKLDYVKDEKKRQEITNSTTIRTTVTNVVKYLGKTAYEKFLDEAFAALFRGMY